MNMTELLFALVGTKVKIIFFDGDVRIGVLGYTKEFSAEFNFRKPKYFTIGDIDFKPSHVKKIEGYK